MASDVYAADSCGGDEAPAYHSAVDARDGSVAGCHWSWHRQGSRFPVLVQPAPSDAVSHPLRLVPERLRARLFPLDPGKDCLTRIITATSGC